MQIICLQLTDTHNPLFRWQRVWTDISHSRDAITQPTDAQCLPLLQQLSFVLNKLQRFLKQLKGTCVQGDSNPSTEELLPVSNHCTTRPKGFSPPDTFSHFNGINLFLQQKEKRLFRIYLIQLGFAHTATLPYSTLALRKPCASVSQSPGISSILANGVVSHCKKECLKGQLKISSLFLQKCSPGRKKGISAPPAEHVASYEHPTRLTRWPQTVNTIVLSSVPCVHIGHYQGSFRKCIIVSVKLCVDVKTFLISTRDFKLTMSKQTQKV